MSQNNTTSLRSVQDCLHALQNFVHALEDEKSILINASKQLLVVMQEDDAAMDTLYHLEGTILPNIDRALKNAEELARYLSRYAEMLIEVYKR